MARRTPRRLSDEEARLFKAAVRDAQPLKSGRHQPGDEAVLAEARPESAEAAASTAPTQAQPAEDAPRPARAAKSATPRKPLAVPEGMLRGETSAPTPSAGPPTGLDRRTATRLRQGRLPVEDRLDLHGMTQAAAHEALRAFIGRARGQGLRCVLVITGKGRFSERGGILRRAVPQWLGEADLAPHVLATRAARPDHGGNGALYVLLRRTRNG